ncbi:unnamed protein product [Ilex paraguariensis]|uniref:Methyltransferase-like protein 2 n=1 Tax=Ilex paraguariensis TaxID=185542 RepID=A0ABC8TPQ9_9AQUA
MADSETNNRLSVFLKTGIYRFESSNAVFIDPVRVLNQSYTQFKVSPTAYYSRLFDSKKSTEEEPRVSKNSRKRKRKERKSHTLNEKERIADQRHKDSRDLLLKAHEALMGATDLLAIIRKLRSGEEESKESLLPSVEQSFVELGSVWQAPLYEITLNLHQEDQPTQSRGSLLVENCDQRVIPVFNNLVINETSSDAEAEFLNNKYVIPKESCFYMSDLRQIHNMIPAESDCGFNLIVVDPPWENSSAHQKMKYAITFFCTLPRLLPLKGFFFNSSINLTVMLVLYREACRFFCFHSMARLFHFCLIYMCKCATENK